MALHPSKSIKKIDETLSKKAVASYQYNTAVQKQQNKICNTCPKVKLKSVFGTRENRWRKLQKLLDLLLLYSSETRSKILKEALDACVISNEIAIYHQ